MQDVGSTPQRHQPLLTSYSAYLCQLRMTLHPRQVLSAFGWSFVQSWGSQLTKLVVFMVLARLLDARDIGVVAFAMVFIQGAQAFALTGVSDALIQKKDLNRETVNAVFWLNMLIAGILALGLFLAAPLLQTWFKMDGLASVLRWVCPVLLLQALAAVQVAQFRRDLKMRPVALRELVASLLGGAAGIYAALTGWGVYALVVNVLVGQFLGTIFLWWSSKWRPGLVIEWRRLSELVSFSSSRTASAALTFLNTRLDDLFVGVFLGPVALGYYAVAYRLLRTINETVSIVLGRAAFPLLARCQDNKQTMVQAFTGITQVGAFASFGLFAVILTLAPQITAVLFGTQWTESVLPMQILCLAGMIQNTVMLNRLLLRASGHALRELYTHVLQAVICSVGFFLAAQISINWVAAVVVAAMACVLPFLASLSAAILGIRISSYFGLLVLPAMAAMVASIAAWGVAQQPFQNSLLSLSSAVIAFLLIFGLISFIGLRKQIAGVSDRARECSLRWVKVFTS